MPRSRKAATWPSAIPALAALAGWIGDPQVRHKGTLGGSIANNDPAADYPAALVALNGTVVTNARRIAADQFFTAMFETALGANEIVTAVEFPVPQQRRLSEVPQPGIALRHGRGVRGRSWRRQCPGGGHRGGSLRVPAARHEAALARSFTPDAVRGIATDPTNLNSDIHASAEYRAHLVGVMARRAVQAALSG